VTIIAASVPFLRLIVKEFFPSSFTSSSSGPLSRSGTGTGNKLQKRSSPSSPKGGGGGGGSLLSIMRTAKQQQGGINTDLGPEGRRNIRRVRQSSSFERKEGGLKDIVEEEEEEEDYDTSSSRGVSRRASLEDMMYYYDPLQGGPVCTKTQGLDLTGYVYALAMAIRGSNTRRLPVSCTHGIMTKRPPQTKLVFPRCRR